LALELAAASTAAGEWAAFVELSDSLGGMAAAHAGVDLERFVVVPRVPPAQWPVVVATLLDGVGLVVAEVPRHARAADARRLVARAREREVVLVPWSTTPGAWPGDAAFRISGEGVRWHGLHQGAGLLDRGDPLVGAEHAGHRFRSGEVPVAAPELRQVG
jgi:hypothetical protein